MFTIFFWGGEGQYSQPVGKMKMFLYLEFIKSMLIYIWLPKKASDVYVSLELDLFWSLFCAQSGYKMWDKCAVCSLNISGTGSITRFMGVHVRRTLCLIYIFSIGELFFIYRTCRMRADPVMHIL